MYIWISRTEILGFPVKFICFTNFTWAKPASPYPRMVQLLFHAGADPEAESGIEPQHWGGIE